MGGFWNEYMKNMVYEKQNRIQELKNSAYFF